MNFQTRSRAAYGELLAMVFSAGFNTVDLNRISETGQMLTALLMVIGGAPGSTAGGMKVTTFVVILACAAAIFKKRQNGQFFGRRVDDDTVKNASTDFLMYITLFLAGGLTLIFATLPATKNTLSRLPIEKISVG